MAFHVTRSIIKIDHIAVIYPLRKNAEKIGIEIKKLSKGTKSKTMINHEKKNSFELIN